jgi:hypothetical protein
MSRRATLDDVAVIASIEATCFGSSAWSEALVADEVRGERNVVLLSDDLTAYGAVSVIGDVADLEPRGCGASRRAGASAE